MKIELEVDEDSVDSIVVQRLKMDLKAIVNIYYDPKTDTFAEDGGGLYDAITTILDYYGEVTYD